MNLFYYNRLIDSKITNDILFSVKWEQVDTSNCQRELAYLILGVKFVIVLHQVGQHNIWPIPVDYKLDGHRHTHKQVIYSIPVRTMAVYQDLNALQSKDFKIIAHHQRVDKVKAVLCLPKNVRHVQVLQVHWL